MNIFFRTFCINFSVIAIITTQVQSKCPFHHDTEEYRVDPLPGKLLQMLK